ncbi:nucleotidyltransferase domain-containing protein [bacterium AH-315-L21]|nr:nucleotidyltransferase domain-containing protein [bacterium AH-315-L21]
MTFGIKKEIFEEIIRILSRDRNIVSAYIFGSRARGDFKDYSDIDIALFVEKKKESSNVSADIDEINCIHKFDIVIMRETTDKGLLNNINRDGVEIYRR